MYRSQNERIAIFLEERYVSAVGADPRAVATVQVPDGIVQEAKRHPVALVHVDDDTAYIGRVEAHGIVSAVNTDRVVEVQHVDVLLVAVGVPSRDTTYRTSQR